MNSDCPADDQLLALATGESISDELREHAGSCAECQTRVKLLRGEIDELRSLTALPAAPPATRIAETADEESPNPAKIGRYVVVGALGSGGQADVYRVIDPNLGRDLVIKLSRHRSGAGDARRDALLGEGRLLAQLDHPGLVRVFEIGIYDDRPFLVLDYVQGRNLEQTYAGKRPSAAEAAQLIAAVARVVAYAHSRGVVHGDITPRNILIDGAGRPRLIDFGLSKIEDAWRDDAGTSGGTPEFLPPEMAFADGHWGTSVPASDVFGLGATFYWLLTGEAPFAAPTSLQALARSQKCDIDFDVLQRLRVPQGVARVCRLALAADPGSRPAPDALADNLRRATRRWITPRVAAGVAAAALACIAIFWSLWDQDDTANGTASVVHSIPTITVDRNRNLSNVLPLHTGDRIAVSCNISQGERAIMLWFDAAGELKQFEPARDVAEKVDRMVYPAPHDDFVLGPPEGTDLIFFCRGGPVPETELQKCFPVGKPPPLLPAQNYLELLRSVVETRGPLERSAIPGEIHQVETLMKDINRALLQQFDGVTGIAFPHRQAGENK
jgi:serine/threonine protein kinase